MGLACCIYEAVQHRSLIRSLIELFRRVVALNSNDTCQQSNWPEVMVMMMILFVPRAEPDQPAVTRQRLSAHMHTV